MSSIKRYSITSQVDGYYIAPFDLTFVPGPVDVVLASDYDALAAALSAAERDALRGLLRQYAQEALDDIDGWAGYASDYFQDRHDLAGDRAKWQARIDAALQERQP